MENDGMRPTERESEREWETGCSLVLTGGVREESLLSLN